jgi:hypothetical protein
VDSGQHLTAFRARLAAAAEMLALAGRADDSRRALDAAQQGDDPENPQVGRAGLEPATEGL